MDTLASLYFQESACQFLPNKQKNTARILSENVLNVQINFERITLLIALCLQIQECGTPLHLCGSSFLFHGIIF